MPSCEILHNWQVNRETDISILWTSLEVFSKKSFAKFRPDDKLNATNFQKFESKTDWRKSILMTVVSVN